MMIKEINGKKVRLLEPVFWKSGSLFVRVKEGDEFYVYSVTIGGDKPKVLPSIDELRMPKSGDRGNYEIIKKTIRPKHPLDKNESYEAVEHYPTCEEWGKLALSYTQWDNVERCIRKKFYGQPFYNEQDREFIREMMNDMTLYN